MPHSFSKFVSVSASTRVPRVFPPRFLMAPHSVVCASTLWEGSFTWFLTGFRTAYHRVPQWPTQVPAHTIPHIFTFFLTEFHTFFTCSSSCCLSLSPTVPYSYQPSTASVPTPVPPTVCQTHLPVWLLASSQVFCLRPYLSTKNFYPFRLKISLWGHH